MPVLILIEVLDVLHSTVDKVVYSDVVKLVMWDCWRGIVIRWVVSRHAVCVSAFIVFRGRSVTVVRSVLIRIYKACLWCICMWNIGMSQWSRILVNHMCDRAEKSIVHCVLLRQVFLLNEGRAIVWILFLHDIQCRKWVVSEVPRRMVTR